MTDATHHHLDAAPAEVLARLPRIGRLMILNSTAGVTHERIGLLDAVQIDGDTAVLTGPDHDSRTDLSAIARMITDRSSVMRDKAFPRIDFLDAKGTAIFSAVSFEGMEPFNAALSGLTEVPQDQGDPGPAPERGNEVAEDDAGRQALDRAQTLGQNVTIRIAQPGFHQQWVGVVETIKPAMGFLNVMAGNFHFHLKGGSIGHWTSATEAGAEVMTAHDPDGNALGLQVVFPG